MVFPDELVRNREANALIGAYTLQDGIDVLLAGTGLIPTFSNKIVLSISTEKESVEKGETMRSSKKAGLIAVLAGVFANDVSSQEANTSIDGTDENNGTAEYLGLEEIVVTGTRLRNDEFTSDLPVQVFTAEEGELLGVTSAHELIRQSTLLTGSIQNDDQQAVVFIGGASINGGNGSNNLSLRGLGAERTLVLMDGRRLSPTGTRGGV